MAERTRIVRLVQGSVRVSLAGERLFVLVAGTLRGLGGVALGADGASLTGRVGVRGVHFACFCG